MTASTKLIKKKDPNMIMLQQKIDPTKVIDESLV